MRDFFWWCVWGGEKMYRWKKNFSYVKKILWGFQPIFGLSEKQIEGSTFPKKSDEFSKKRIYIHHENSKLLPKWVRKYFKLEYLSIIFNKCWTVHDYHPTGTIVEKNYFKKSLIFFWFPQKFANIIGWFHRNFIKIDF